MNRLARVGQQIGVFRNAFVNRIQSSFGSEIRAWRYGIGSIDRIDGIVYHVWSSVTNTMMFGLALAAAGTPVVGARTEAKTEIDAQIEITNARRV